MLTKLSITLTYILKSIWNDETRQASQDDVGTPVPGPAVVPNVGLAVCKVWLVCRTACVPAPIEHGPGVVVILFPML